MPGIGLIIVDPGHFHVALVQQEMYPNVAARAHVYAPLGPDLLDYLTRIERFNSRAEQPTGWEVELHASSDFLERLSRERPGNVAIISGRNRSSLPAWERANMLAKYHVCTGGVAMSRGES